MLSCSVFNQSSLPTEGAAAKEEERVACFQNLEDIMTALCSAGKRGGVATPRDYKVGGREATMKRLASVGGGSQRSTEEANSDNNPTEDDEGEKVNHVKDLKAMISVLSSVKRVSISDQGKRRHSSLRLDKDPIIAAAAAVEQHNATCSRETKEEDSKSATRKNLLRTLSTKN